jgi:pre-mRNA-splicing factor ISY1
MARNQEKAQSMLNKFLQSKKDEAEQKSKRPFLASDVTDVTDAEKWRYQVVKEIAKKVGEIQNRGLSESSICDLNDEINKLIREKGHWERRIMELGGPNYRLLAKPTDYHRDSIGESLSMGLGYRYFGAARTLPGVKQLFQKEAPRLLKKTRYNMYQNINSDYYGLRDEDDFTIASGEKVTDDKIIINDIENFGSNEKILKYSFEKKHANKQYTLEKKVETDSSTNNVKLPRNIDIEDKIITTKRQKLFRSYITKNLQSK